ncbi:hypothetical protein FEMY_04340 [Ferrovum myxofaciens]|uniref:Uncharacterized protein n=1 Tax=Ferrovum myxofaciens TaxID=416213 RepID=A0A149W0A3_9PROT|nr:hypothetical protein FEMY_04340 [Ferrovum myxofaciens]
MSIPNSFNGKTRRHTWDYRNEQGEIIGHVARYDGDGKKDIAPFFRRISGYLSLHFLSFHSTSREHPPANNVDEMT